MDKLWAPWRIGYISGKKERGCIFCIPKKTDKKYDSKKLIITRSRHSFCILNKYPYNNGHMMVAPYRHVPSIEHLTGEEILDIFDLIKRTKRALEKLFKPDGFNIGVNIGRSAGAGVKGHVHIHIVPRWDGDNNFMPAIGGVKVISQSLEDLYKKIKGMNAYTERSGK